MKPELEVTITAARSGDRAALDRVCARFYPRVARMVHRTLAQDLRGARPWLGSLFSTGDVVQEVFLSVLRDLGEFRGNSEWALMNYLATLTRNRLVDAIRFHEAARRDRRRLGEEPEALEGYEDRDAGPEGHAIADEQAARFHDVLASFPERDRILLRERIENRVTFEQLATMLGYASGDSTRKAFHAAQARLLFRLRRR
jgi:RNA polymerase sigma factor (sigma-70 family)